MKTRIGTRTRILFLILAIAIVTAILPHWDRHRINRDFADTMELVRYARSLAQYRNIPHVILFEGKTATLKNMATGKEVKCLRIGTLSKVNYETKQGKNRIIFHEMGTTATYNVHEHGGDLKLKSWFGLEKSIWVHCTGLATEGEMVPELPASHK